LILISKNTLNIATVNITGEYIYSEIGFMRLILHFVNGTLIPLVVTAFVPVLWIPIASAQTSKQNPTPITSNSTGFNSVNQTPDLEVTYLKAIQNHWAKIFIQGLAQRNLISKSQEFQPDQRVTRAEFAIIVDRAFPFQPVIRQAIAFSDVPTDFWAALAIQSAYTKGFSGFSGNNNQNAFRPNELMRRSEAMVAIANGLGLPRNPKLDPKVFLFSMYADAALIPEAAIAPIAALTDKQIIVNYPNVREINPNGLITRAELSALIYQSLVHTGQLPKISSNFIPSLSNPLFNTTNLVGTEIITHLKVNLRRREVVAYQGTKKLNTYPLGVGRAGWDTPSGTYQVKQIIRNPDWKNPFTGDVIKASDRDNPLGGYWIGFWTNGKDWSGFHGTSQRDSVGKASSHGCLRMYKEDIKAIFARVTPATIVEISR
jgi:lipoprotein-anchoring transpeptidase ErfK/SrfK